MRTLALFTALLLFGCATPTGTIPVAPPSPVTTIGQDVSDLAKQATQAYLDYKAGNVNWAYAISQGLWTYQTWIKTKSDFKEVVAAWGADGNFADKLARIFAASTAPPSVKTDVIATAIEAAATTKK